MKKKIVGIIALMALSCTAVAAYGCSGQGSKTAQLTDATYTMYLHTKEFNLIVGDSAMLTAQYDQIEGEKLTFHSDAESIVQVSQDGVIMAIKEGQATITAKYGEKTDTATVSVSFGEFVPQCYLYQAEEERPLSVYKNETLNVSGYILFNGNAYDDAEFSYTLSDPTFGNVENGIFTASDKTGEVELLVSCEWRGFEGALLTERYTIEVLNMITLTIEDVSNENAVEIYSTAKVADDEFVNTFVVNAVCTENGQAVSPNQLVYEITDGADLIEFDEETQTLTGKKAGRATLTVSYTDEAGKTYSQNLFVNVLRPVVDYAETIAFDAYLGELPLEEIFGETVSLISAEGVEGETLTISENTVQGVDVPNALPTERKLTVYSEALGVNLKIKAYSRIIKTAEDLSYFQYVNDTEKAFSGYYILANNIDASGYSHPVEVDGGKAYSSVGNKTGLTGTFDGQGYTIDGYTLRGNGLFGALTENGTIKNLGMTNVKFASATASYNPVFAATVKSMSGSPTLENVYVESSFNGIIGVFFQIQTKNFTMKNCIFELSGTRTDITARDHGSLCAWTASDFTAFADMKFANTYIRSSLKATNGAAVSNNKEWQNIVADAMNIDGAQIKWNGLYRYETAAEMKAAGNDYSSFPSEYWTVETGEIPVWRTAQ